MTAPHRKIPFRAGSGTTAAPALAPESAGPQVLLADISEWQPQIADAAYAAWSQAIVIRAAYGDAHDDTAWYGGQRRDFLHKAGIRFLGIYQYLVAGQDGGAQAQALHNLVGALRPGEILIADYEEGARAVLTAWYNKMHQLYPQAAWQYLWTYSGLNFGAAKGVLPVEWIAAYQPSEPASLHKLWQFTSTYPVPGVGTCDCSVFHGTIDELAALAYPGQPVPLYGPPQDVAVSQDAVVSISWKPPAPVTGLPAVPDSYRVYLHDGSDQPVPGYPQTLPGTQTTLVLPLPRGKSFIFNVVASTAGGTNTEPKAGGPFTV
jgi:hypothetical protein